MIKTRQLPSQELLHELLQYDELSGRFYWKVRRSGRTKAGDEAGCMRSDGYKLIGINGIKYRSARLAFKYIYGRDPVEIDHRKTKSDSIENLREANRFQNNRNMPLRKDNKSGLKGVYWHKRQAKWVAMLGYNGKQKHLGTFDTKEQAYAAYCVVASQLHGAFARLS